MTASLSADDVHLRAIRAFYGERRAERSDVPLIHPVHEGLTILDALDALNISFLFDKQ